MPIKYHVLVRVVKQIPYQADILHLQRYVKNMFTFVRKVKSSESHELNGIRETNLVSRVL